MSGNSYKIKLEVIILSALLIIISRVAGQGVESIYSTEIQTGSKVLVITNWDIEFGDDTLYVCKDVSKLKGPSLLSAEFTENSQLDFQPLNEEEFKNEVLGWQSNCLLFVHGDSKTFEQAVMRGFDIQHLYGINTIVFSWPSRDLNINGAKNFKKSKKTLIASLSHFIAALKLIDSIRQEDPGRWNNYKFSMFMHSLGNYYLENLVKTHQDSIFKRKLFDNIIMNAAAVNQDSHYIWLQELMIQEQIIVTANKQDFNLKGVRVFTKDGKQLGEKVKQPLADNATYFHFTKAVGFRFPTGSTHTYFIGKMADKRKNIEKFYSIILNGNKVDINDNLMFSKRKDGRGYDLNKKP